MSWKDNVLKAGLNSIQIAVLISRDISIISACVSWPSDMSELQSTLRDVDENLGRVKRELRHQRAYRL